VRGASGGIGDTVENTWKVALLAVSWGGTTRPGFKQWTFDLILFSVQQSHIREAFL